MVNKIESLTEKLTNRADKKLTKEVDELFSEPVKQLMYLDRITIFSNDKIFSRVDNDGHYEIHPKNLIKILKEHLIDKRKDKFRKAELDEFLKKVENVHDEIDNLYNEVHEVRNNA